MVFSFYFLIIYWNDLLKNHYKLWNFWSDDFHFITNKNSHKNLAWGANSLKTHSDQIFKNHNTYSVYRTNISAIGSNTRSLGICKKGIRNTSLALNFLILSYLSLVWRWYKTTKKWIKTCHLKIFIFFL